jgi:anti-anti-sigma factor
VSKKLELDPALTAKVLNLADHFVMSLEPSFMAQGGDLAFARLYEPLLGQGKGFVVDFEKVDSLDSKRLAAIVIFYKRAVERKIKIVFCGASRSLNEVFMVTRLDRVLTIVPTRDAAIETISAKTQ